MADQLHVEDAGNPHGLPVLFIHGFMSSNLQWEPNRPGLSAELRLLLTEQPGHGDSPGPDDVAAFRATTVISQLEEVRTRHGIDRWWVVGQSLGGGVAVRYVLAHPERVAGLVFTNSRAVFGMTAQRAIEQSRSEGKPSQDLPKNPTREQIQALPYHPSNARRIPAELQARMVEKADAMPLTVFRHLRSAGPWNSTDDLHRLAVPTLLINGRFEKAFQPCVAQAREAIPDLRVIDLDGGHSVNIDQPEGFNQAVLDFIADTAASTGHSPPKHR